MEVLFFVFFLITWGLQAWILIEGYESFRDLRGRVQELKSESLENGFRLKKVADDVFKTGIEAAATAYDLHSLRKRLDKAPAAGEGGISLELTDVRNQLDSFEFEVKSLLKALSPKQLEEKVRVLESDLRDARSEETYWNDEYHTLKRELTLQEQTRAQRNHTTEQARTWAIEDLLRKGLPIDETVRELRAIDNEHGYGAWK